MHLPAVDLCGGQNSAGFKMPALLLFAAHLPDPGRVFLPQATGRCYQCVLYLSATFRMFTNASVRLCRGTGHIIKQTLSIFELEGWVLKNSTTQMICFEGNLRRSCQSLFKSRFIFIHFPLKDSMLLHDWFLLMRQSRITYLDIPLALCN